MAASTIDRNRLVSNGHLSDEPEKNGSEQFAGEPDAVLLARMILEKHGYGVVKKDTGRSLQHFLRCVRKACNVHKKFPQIEVDECKRRLEKHYKTERSQLKDHAVWDVEKGTFVTKAAMTELAGNVGGYLLPIDYGLGLMEVIAEESFIYPRARIEPMASEEKLLPRWDVETQTTNIGVSSLLAGIQFRWGFGQAPAETEPQFRALNLHAWDLLGYAFMSNDMLADTGAEGEKAILKMFGRAAAWYAEYAFLQGTGSAQSMPIGMLNAPCVLNVARNTAATIKIQDVTGMTSALLPRSWGRAIFAVNPVALAQVQQLASYFINIELGGMHKVSPRPAGVLSTFPLYVTEKLPPLGARGDLLLFDPELYVIGNRMECLVDVSPDDKFQNNQTTFRVWLRLDGAPWISNTIKLADNSTIVSSVVALK